MTDVGYKAPDNFATALSTELNTLATGGSATSGVITPSGTARKQYVDIAVSLASFTPQAGGSIAVYILPAVDDTPTNFADITSTQLVGTIALTSGASAKYGCLYGVLAPNRPYKIATVNNAGTALAGSGNTVSYSQYQETTA